MELRKHMLCYFNGRRDEWMTEADAIIKPFQWLHGYLFISASVTFALRWGVTRLISSAHSHIFQPVSQTKKD